MYRLLFSVRYMVLKYSRKGHNSLSVWISSPDCTFPSSYDFVSIFVRECVKGGLAVHFLKNCLDVGVDEGGRIIRVLILHGQIMGHDEQLRTSRGPSSPEDHLRVVKYL